MPDEQTEQSQDTLAETQEGADQQESSEVQEDSGDKFSKAQLQQLSSMMGDMIKRKIEDYGEKHVVPLIDRVSSQAATTDVYRSPSTNPAKQQLNQRLQEMIFDGQVMEAYDEYERVKSAAHENLSKANQNKLAVAMGSFKDNPLFADLKNKVQEHASEYINRGWPPEAAAAMAWERSEKSHYKRQLSGDSDEGSLEMAGGGRRAVRKGKVTLPPQFEEAFQRDKAKGLFSKREEFIESLSPTVKAMLEL